LEIEEKISLTEIKVNDKAFFGLLLSTGYLTVSQQLSENIVYVRIPNREVKGAYKDFIDRSIRKITSKNILLELIDNRISIEERERSFEIALKRAAMSSVSFHDEYENFYHGMMFGLSMPLIGYELASNRESGQGRPDLILENREDKEAIVIEVKRGDSEDKQSLKKRSQEGLQQIKDKQYYAPLQERNVAIKLLSISFFNKELSISYEEIN